ncbi:unnamed protein product [Closterium sp. Naga37s-1]|nr:unnamed protein product [Closterium sp. Naga37s-1]
MPKIKVLFFARARELVGAAEQTLELPADADSRLLLERLYDAHPPLRDLAQSVVMAVNREYVSPSDPPTVLKDGDEVALIPPISASSLLPSLPSPFHRIFPRAYLSPHRPYLCLAARLAHVLRGVARWRALIRYRHSSRPRGSNREGRSTWAWRAVPARVVMQGGVTIWVAFDLVRAGRGASSPGGTNGSNGRREAAEGGVEDGGDGQGRGDVEMERGMAGDMGGMHEEQAMMVEVQGLWRGGGVGTGAMWLTLFRTHTDASCSEWTLLASFFHPPAMPPTTTTAAASSPSAASLCARERAEGQQGGGEGPHGVVFLHAMHLLHSFPLPLPHSTPLCCPTPTDISSAPFPASAASSCASSPPATPPCTSLSVLIDLCLPRALHCSLLPSQGAFSPTLDATRTSCTSFVPLPLSLLPLLPSYSLPAFLPLKLSPYQTAVTSDAIPFLLALLSLQPALPFLHPCLIPPPLSAVATTVAVQHNILIPILFLLSDPSSSSSPPAPGPLPSPHPAAHAITLHAYLSLSTAPPHTHSTSIPSSLQWEGAGSRGCVLLGRAAVEVWETEGEQEEGEEEDAESHSHLPTLQGDGRTDGNGVSSGAEGNDGGGGSDGEEGSEGGGAGSMAWRLLFVPDGTDEPLSANGVTIEWRASRGAMGGAGGGGETKGGVEARAGGGGGGRGEEGFRIGGGEGRGRDSGKEAGGWHVSLHLSAEGVRSVFGCHACDSATGS